MFLDKERVTDYKMDEKMDLRTKMTIQLLTDALFKLMQQKKFEEISVKEICKEAQVNRSTFYNRFEDKHQLLAQLFKELQDKFTQNFPENKRKKPSKEYYLYIFEQMLKAMKEHKAFYEHNFISRGDYIRQVFNESFSIYIYEQLKDVCNSGEIAYTMPISVIAEFYTGAALSLAEWWFKNEMSVSMEEMRSYIDTLISNNVVI